MEKVFLVFKNGHEPWLWGVYATKEVAEKEATRAGNPENGLHGKTWTEVWDIQEEEETM